LDNLIKYQVHPLNIKKGTQDKEVLDRGGSVRLLTQNMYMLPGLPEGKVKLHKDDRMKQFVIRVLPEFDIICCQETFYTVNARKETLNHYAQMSGFAYSAKS
jgi:hypothetical protein